MPGPLPVLPERPPSTGTTCQEPLCAAGADFIALGDNAFSDPRGWAAAVADAAKHLRVRIIA